VNVVGEPLTLNTTVGYFGFGALYAFGGASNVWGGPITLDVNAPIDVASGLLLNITGPISGSGGVVVPGAGVLVYGGSATNTYAGTTTVNSGTLSLDRTAFANAAIPGNVVVNSSGTLRLASVEQIADAANVTVNTGGLFDFSSFFESIDMLTGTGNVTFGSGGFLEIGANGGTSTFNGVMSGIGYPGGYTVGKFGSGTFTLNNTNTYQNGSDVFGGTLIINGSQPQSPIRALNSGATLGGSGVVGDIPIAAGSIAPGVAGSPTILTCSNLVFDSTGNFTVRLDGFYPGNYDQLVVLDTNFLGNATLTLLPSFSPAPVINQQFTIINNQGGGPIVGTFNGLPDNTVINAGGYFFRINYNATGTSNVVLTAVGPVVGNTVTIDSAYRGWYDSTGYHDPANTVNYLCGGDDGASTNLYRNWFVFNAPVSSSSIISAELIVNSFSCLSATGEQTYLVRGVTTPINTLVAGGSGHTNIYLDLGSSNAVYGERNIETNEAGQFLIIPLNVKFIKDITAEAGHQFALGGSIIPSPLTNAFVFGFSAFSIPSDVQLRLTYGNSVTLTAADTGWYDNTGGHNAGNPNYIAGVSGPTFHDFFLFNLPIISGPLVSAGLLVSNYNIVNPAGSNLYQLYDVTTPITTLTNNAAGATGTYADLGSGVVYGGRDVFVSESSLQAGIPLDSEFVSAVYANSGGQIALGGANSSTSGYVFGSSGFSLSDAQLWLGFLSAPATTPVFVNSTNLANSVVKFTLSGTSGTSNEIQGTVDFTNWDFMGDLFMTNTNSVFIYTNSYPTPPTNYPNRFFRARILP
jgi:autotransporter-associated beta strand protein